MPTTRMLWCDSWWITYNGALGQLALADRGHNGVEGRTQARS